MHKVIQSKLKQAQTKLLYALPIMAIVITLALATGIYLENTVGFTHAEANTASGNGGATVTAAANRDLHSVTSWTPTRSTIDSTNKNMSAYPIVIEEWATGWNNDEDTPYSVDAGYKYILPIEKTSAGNGGATEMLHDIVYNSLEDCQDTADNSNENSFGLVCDGHLSVGNYYNFAAASATNSVSGTLVAINKEDAPNVDLPDSICPKGWRLPEENSDNSGSEFNILLGAKNYNIIDSFNPSGLNTIRKPPLYLMRSGDVNGGVLHYVGAYAHAWSSTISMTNMGFLLRFNSSYYYPAYGNHRYYGFPVRCLARTE